MSKCEFAIRPSDLGGGAELPEGFHYVDDYLICPRGLEGKGAQPNGKKDCPLYSVEECSRAMGEVLNCPELRRREEKGFRKIF